MSDILHLLNGDSTYNSFRDTGLEGDVSIWREALVEGPLEGDITSAEFWNRRSEWIREKHHETEAGYREKVLDELARLNEPYREINLWFEFDLFCQANLLGAMMLLERKDDLSAPAVFLVCPSEFPGKSVFRGMGELTGSELEYLYDNIRVQLDKPDFVVAEEAWQAYRSKDPEALKLFIAQTTFWGNLHLLKPALEAQVSLLEQNAEGLNYIEQRLLELYKNGHNTREVIYGEFWNTELIFGFGDAQLDSYLNPLKTKGLIS